MTTAMLVRLRQGARTLTLTSGRYALADDFVPPPVSKSVLLAHGTSANRYGGAKVAGRRYNQRTWSFGLHTTGASEREVARAIADVQAFLDLAGDESDPLYVEVYPNTDIGPDPLWGQSGLRYEVDDGTAVVSELYSVMDARGYALPGGRVNLTIKPFALGRPQRLASATGGVFLDTLGTPDGRSRGPVFMPATTNEMTNPVFGHTTYDNDWTAGSSLVASKNTDPAYLLHETRASVKITSQATTNNTYTQSISLAAASRILWAIVMLPDGGTPSSADVEIIYAGVTQTTGFTNLGNGRWAIEAGVTGTGNSAAVGIEVKSGRTVYLLFFQAASGTNSNRSIPCWGDLLGCSWSGTAHASTSSRTAGRVRVPVDADTFNLGQGTIILAWKTRLEESIALDQFLFSCGSAGIEAWFEESTDKFHFTDDTNAISTDAQNWAVGDVIWLAFVWGPSGLAIYKNGALASSNSTYTPPALPSYVYIGTDASAANPGYGPFMDFRIYGEALTAAEVAADYANVVQVTADGQRVGDIPWLWTKDGDGVVDNHDDSGEDNFCVVAGVPGNVPAETEFLINVGTNYNTDSAIWLWLNDLARFVPMSYWHYSDRSGTVDANSSGGQYETPGSTVTSGGYDLWSWTLTLTDVEPLIGKQFVLIARVSDPGSGLELTSNVVYGNLADAAAFRSVAADSTMRLFVTNPQFFGQVDTEDTSVAIALAARRLDATAVPAADFFIVATRPLLTIKKQASVSAVDVDIELNGRVAKLLNNATGKLNHFAGVTGDALELRPERYNVIGFASGDIGTAMTIARTATFSKVTVTPRFSLL